MGFAAKKGRKLNLDKLLARIVELMVRHHPATLSFSKVSQLTSVPRPTLYYYFGNNKDAMIAEAVRFGMKGFVQLVTLDKNRNYPDWESFQRARFRVSTQVIRKHPWAPGLYFRYRNDPGELGRSIREVEEKYMEKIALVWKKYHGKLPDPRALRLSSYLKLGLFWGLSNEAAFWYARENRKFFRKLVDAITEISSETMARKFG